MNISMERKIMDELVEYLNEHGLWHGKKSGVSGKDVSEFTYQNEDWLGYELVLRESDCEFWFEAVTTKVTKNRVLGIVFNHDVDVYFDPDNDIKEVCDILAQLHYESVEIRALLKDIK